MNPILLIKYAVNGCSAEQVSRVFDQLFDDSVVERVVTLNKTNYTTGMQFYMFFIHFKKINDSLQEFIDGFQSDNVQRVVYNDPWYWNVVIAEARTPPPPRIMPAKERKP